jgi:hypothetical protein
MPSQLGDSKQLLCTVQACTADQETEQITHSPGRFFPATVYLSTSKLAVATVGNLSFAMALCMYNLVIKVWDGLMPGSDS